ncbi:MAG: lipase family protein [Bacteroidota bacterium]
MRSEFQIDKALLCLLLLLCTAATSGCENGDDGIVLPKSTERGHLVSYAKAGDMTANAVVSAGVFEGDVSSYTSYDIDLYSIVYNSLDSEELLEVSGLVIVPKGAAGRLHLIQHHHGTIIPGDDDEVPSTYSGGRNGSSEMYFIGATMASNGYVVSMPDYVGYGASADREHPYTVHYELAEVSVDMLRATKQLLDILNIEVSNDVFLTGWSEGGGAGLATHKHIQEKYADEFAVKGSSLFAGPYDYMSFVNDVLMSRNLEDEELSIYSWSLYAINNYYAELGRAPNGIWTYSVSDQIDALYVPSLKPGEVFESSFMDGITNGTDVEWITALRQNTLLEGWVPQGELFFHSGTDDFIVPHYNSVHAHEQFQSVNARSTLYEYPGGDHYRPLYDYVTTTLDDFGDL